MKLKYILKGSQILLFFYSVIFLILRGALVLTRYFQQLRLEEAQQIQMMQAGSNGADMTQMVMESSGGGTALAVSLGIAVCLLALDVWSILEHWIRQKKEEWNVRRLYGASEGQIYFQMEKYFLILLLIAAGISWIPFRMLHGILEWMKFPADLSVKEEVLLYLGVAVIGSLMNRVELNRMKPDQAKGNRTKPGQSRSGRNKSYRGQVSQAEPDQRKSKPVKRNQAAKGGGNGSEN